MLFSERMLRDTASIVFNEAKELCNKKCSKCGFSVNGLCQFMISMYILNFLADKTHKRFNKEFEQAEEIDA